MILSFVLGVAASFIAWLVVVLLLRPKLSWDPGLRRFQAGSEVWYYADLRNRRMRKVIGVTVTARLRVKGLYDGHSDRWATFDVPLDDAHVPLLKGTWKSSRSNMTRFGIIRNGSARQGFRLMASELTTSLRARIPGLSSFVFSSGTDDLGQLLALGERAELYRLFPDEGVAAGWVVGASVPG